MSHLSPLLLLHIGSAVVSLLAGVLSMMFRKGSGRHRAAGDVFTVAMLSMATSAVYLALFVKPNMLNAVVGMLTVYLVSTGWWAARRKDGGTGRFDLGALLFILAVGMVALSFGLEAAASTSGTKNGMPAGLYFFFGSMSLLGAVSDVRMFRRGGLAGGHRIARHLWRMGLALLLALFSFFPGQAKLFSGRSGTGILLIPHLFVLASTLYWRFRVMRRKRTQPVQRAYAEVPLTRPLGV